MSAAPQKAVPAPLLVLGAIVSVQFGGALAATLVPEIGAGGSVVLRLSFATVILLVMVRPRWRGHSRAAWMTVISFGVALGLMNFAFYASLAHLPIGVAVTVEFIGPLTLAAALSRRIADALSVALAAVGILLISQALTMPLGELPWRGLLLAAAAGVCWAAYIIFSGRTGAAFDRLEGLALAMVVATVITLPFGITTAGSWTPEVLAKGLGIALLSSVLPYSLELVALRRMTAQVFGIMLSLEPAVAAVAGLAILGQRLTLVQLLGMSLVVVASAIVLGFGARKEPAESTAT
ncbi:MAG: EamA family transporter [Intrasporangiaceae bacterium]|nr:EamA family transporter [Intrasporangiaceae bacterium]